MESKIEIYQTADNQTNVDVQFDGDTVWLSQKQMAQIFGKDSDTIGLHLKNIYASKELDKGSTTENYSVVQSEGTRSVSRKVKHYNLDAIISVGYRVNSKEGVQFRRWATNKLKELLVDGFSINKKRLEQKEQEVIHLKNGIKILSRVIEEKANFSQEDEWIEEYAVGLKLLDDYDHQALDRQGVSSKPTNYPEEKKYSEILQLMREQFNSEIFGKEKDGGFKSAIEQIKKGFNDKDFYPSTEEKAANLLYLIVKNHAFIDGNKRIAAACFLLFLKENNILKNSTDQPLISNEALAGITLFVASSKAEEKESVVNLIVSILNRNQS